MSYFSKLAIPITIIYVLLYGIVERKNVYDIFIDGAKDGIEQVIKIFPTLIGLFVAVGVLRSSGVIDAFINIISPITRFLNIPKEIIPLAILRPISRKCFISSWYRYYENIWCR